MVSCHQHRYGQDTRVSLASDVMDHSHQHSGDWRHDSRFFDILRNNHGCSSCEVFPRRHSLPCAVSSTHIVCFCATADAVKYSDVDYSVYTDAARHVWNGESPFDRVTFRYAPILSVTAQLAIGACSRTQRAFPCSAWILVPTVWLPEFGKLLFCACDLLIALLSWRVLHARGVHQRSIATCLALFLLNPFTINISTRGNADSIVCALVVAALAARFEHRVLISALLLGLAVHVKLYPIIYVLPFLWSIASVSRELLKSQPGTDTVDESVCKEPYVRGLLRQVTRVVPWLTADRIVFSAVCGCTFVALFGLVYATYGTHGVYEAYLYHFVRADNRHNFSAYFYDIYLTMLPTAAAGAARWATAVQVGTGLMLAWRYRNDLAFALFLQTWVFVAFNKVITVQYFMWYLALLPMVTPDIRLSPVIAMLLCALWFASEMSWNVAAGLLELAGLDAFSYVWVNGMVFLLVNCVCMAVVIRAYRREEKTT